MATVEDLVVGLRQLRVTCRSPIYRAISRRAGRAGYSLAPSTITALLTARDLPTVNAVTGFLRGLEVDAVEEREWLDAWRRLAIAREAARVRAG